MKTKYLSECVIYHLKWSHQWNGQKLGGAAAAKYLAQWDSQKLGHDDIMQNIQVE